MSRGKSQPKLNWQALGTVDPISICKVVNNWGKRLISTSSLYMRVHTDVNTHTHSDCSHMHACTLCVCACVYVKGLCGEWVMKGKKAWVWKVLLWCWLRWDQLRHLQWEGCLHLLNAYSVDRVFSPVKFVQCVGIGWELVVREEKNV